jgi:hypothetical protein
MEALVPYLVAAMTSWVPLHAHPETTEDTTARYESIARDAATVAYDEGEEPLFPGAHGRAETAVLMLAIASLESAFKKTVDDGVGRGDHGRSYCLMQIHVGDGTTREGWSGPDLVADRARCFRAALHVLRGSFAACHRLPLEDRMSAYASGHCFEGAEVSRVRIGRALGWWQTHALPTDV